MASEDNQSEKQTFWGLCCSYWDTICVVALGNKIFLAILGLPHTHNVLINFYIHKVVSEMDIFICTTTIQMFKLLIYFLHIPLFQRILQNLF